MQEFVVLGLVMILGLGAYWSLVIFPKQREFQQQHKYVSELQLGDEMITYGGVIARIIEVDADNGIAKVEIAEGVVVRVLIAALVRPYDPNEIAESARLAARQPEPTSTTTNA